MNETRLDIREFFARELGRDVSLVSDQESLLEAGILDSIGVMALVSFLESKYAIVVPDDALMPENFDSIDAIASFVVRRRSGQHA